MAPFIKEIQPKVKVGDVLVVPDARINEGMGAPAGFVLRDWEVIEIVKGKPEEKIFRGLITIPAEGNIFITQEIRRAIGPGEIRKEFKEDDWVENIVRKEKKTYLHRDLDDSLGSTHYNFRRCYNGKRKAVLPRSRL